jgi:hypothetical protein
VLSLSIDGDAKIAAFSGYSRRNDKGSIDAAVTTAACSFAG